ncbi:ribonuclease M5 [Spiroplasma sp. TIUS-1]|uniref:ribonuclease M5 n=1 Tax=Spiroplasma sp. TIUS-1 TaxID=216963 RepID=UPI0013989396|nr:ribonuclease M5 [Spiroplasma sp. TIUS-1]QHX36243.1 ribonuclease M5 [Spiroplasma sp. TIUS-1]
MIIIVEGKTDIEKLKSVYGNNINVISTNGMGINLAILNQLKELSKNNKIVIFTDPDGPGLKIREKISDFLDNKCFHAFIDKKNIKGNKIGVAEANKEDIKKALDNLIEFNNENQTITWDEYIENEFFLKENRIKICKKYGWPQEISSKKLFKWMNLYGVKN